MPARLACQVRYRNKKPRKRTAKTDCEVLWFYTLQHLLFIYVAKPNKSIAENTQSNFSHIVLFPRGQESGVGGVPNSLTNLPLRSTSTTHCFHGLNTIQRFMFAVSFLSCWLRYVTPCVELPVVPSTPLFLQARVLLAAFARRRALV